MDKTVDRGHRVFEVFKKAISIITLVNLKTCFFSVFFFFGLFFFFFSIEKVTALTIPNDRARTPMSIAARPFQLAFTNLKEKKSNQLSIF